MPETCYDPEEYDTQAIEIDQRNGNFSTDRLEDYRHAEIVQSSLANGQFSQARRQCAEYRLSYDLELQKFNQS